MATPRKNAAVQYDCFINGESGIHSQYGLYGAFTNTPYKLWLSNPPCSGLRSPFISFTLRNGKEYLTDAEREKLYAIIESNRDGILGKPYRYGIGLDPNCYKEAEDLIRVLKPALGRFSRPRK